MLCSVQPKTAGGRVFPCRQCMPCRINDSRKWVTRLVLEWTHGFAQHGRPGAFITLTYAPEFLPPDGVQVRHAQLFLKRLRKASPWPIRYLMVGEYGELSGRAHYHALVFGSEIEWMMKNLQALWPFGLVHVGTISPSSVAYVADYCLKVPRGRSCSSDGRNPPFRLMSRKPGIGGNALEDVAKALVSWEGAYDELDELGVPKEVRMDGSVRPLDRYVRRKLENLLSLDRFNDDNFRRLIVQSYSRPVLTEEEKVDRRRAAQAQGLAKHQRMKRKEKL